MHTAYNIINEQKKKNRTKRRSAAEKLHTVQPIVASVWKEATLFVEKLKRLKKIKIKGVVIVLISG